LLLIRLAFYHFCQARIPALLEGSNADIMVPAFCSVFSGRGEGRKGEVYATMAWVGPKGTVTPLHRDPYHNCFAQVRIVLRKRCV